LHTIVDKFYSPCQLHFVGRVRPTGCPADIKNFLTMPAFLVKLWTGTEIFCIFYPSQIKRRANALRKKKKKEKDCDSQA